MVLAFFGHHIEDEDVLKAFKQMKEMKKKPSFIKKIKMAFGMVYVLVFGPRNLIKTKTEYMDKLKYDMVDKVRNATNNNNNSKEILKEIGNEYAKVAMVQGRNHGPVSMGSSIKHMLLRGALEGALSES